METVVHAQNDSGYRVFFNVPTKLIQLDFEKPRLGRKSYFTIPKVLVIKAVSGKHEKATKWLEILAKV